MDDHPAIEAALAAVPKHLTGVRRKVSIAIRHAIHDANGTMHLFLLETMRHEERKRAASLIDWCDQYRNDRGCPPTSHGCNACIAKHEILGHTWERGTGWIVK